jgi:hypothetical protein
MIVNHRLEFVFFGVPRTGSYSMEAALTPLQSSKFYGKHLFGAPEFTEHYFKFCCVRNPYAREWSHYNYRKSRKGNKMNPWACRWSFSQYAGWSVDETLPPVQYHDETMSEMLRGIELDFVLRYENLAADWARLAGVANIPQLRTDLPHLRATKDKDFKSQYDQRIADLIYEWAKEDFDQFGYDKDSWK